MKRLFHFFLLILVIPTIVVLTSGCGQIMTPTGGPRDSLPPKLISATPPPGTTNFKGNRITLTFNEYVRIEELQKNLLVSPTPKNNPYIDFKLRTVTIKLRDTLESNTTYTINLGNSIRDVNENNILKDFRYAFSTGPVLDSLTLSGKVEIAETGKIDSTLIVLLYKNLQDSAVIKQKPKYIERLDGSGRFTFINLAEGAYKIYALKDMNGSKTYDSKSEIFAFTDKPVTVNSKTTPVNLLAYAEEKEKPKPAPAEKKLKYSTKITNEKQSLLADIKLEFNKPLKTFDKQKILLTDTLNNSIKNIFVNVDSSRKTVTINNKWKEDEPYKLIILKDAATDTSGNTLSKSDTIQFTTKKESDYGSIGFKFLKYDQTKNPVLQFVVSDEVLYSYPLTAASWSAAMFEPGEYELRILYDDDKNGKWDPGNFATKKQPERVYYVPQKLLVRANFERDVTIEL